MAPSYWRPNAEISCCHSCNQRWQISHSLLSSVFLWPFMCTTHRHLHRCSKYNMILKVWYYWHLTSLPRLWGGLLSSLLRFQGWIFIILVWFHILSFTCILWDMSLNHMLLFGSLTSIVPQSPCPDRGWGFQPVRVCKSCYAEGHCQLCQSL